MRIAIVAGEGRNGFRNLRGQKSLELLPLENPAFTGRDRVPRETEKEESARTPNNEGECLRSAQV